MPLPGYRHSDEIRAKISAATKGKPRPHTPEHGRALSLALTGRKLSDAHRAKLSAIRKGVPKSPEFAARVSATMKGVPKSPEHAAHIKNPPVKGECVYCFGPAQSLDHVIPIRRGGTNDPDNLVLACYACNRSKNNRTPEEWFAGVRPPR